MTDILLVQDVYDALRIRMGSTGENEPRDEQLDSYIAVMTGYGAGILDQVTVKEAGAHDEGEPTHVVTVRFPTPSDMWRSIKRNINKGGFFLQVAPFASMDTMVTVQVTLEQPALQFESPAKVIFVNPQERSGRPMGVGIKFLWGDEKAAMFKRFLKGEVDPNELGMLAIEESPPAPEADASPAAASA